MVEITVLGSGSSVPTARRNHPGILLDYKAEHMLFDCGEGIQRQFRKAGKNPMKLTRLFISHWHGDHVLGIPGLLNTLQLNGYKRTLEIYGPRGTKKFVNLMMRIFVRRDKVSIKVHEVSKGKIVDEDDFYVEATPMDHKTPAIAYSFVVKDSLRIDKKKLSKFKLGRGELQKLQKLKQGKDVVVSGKKLKYKTLTYKQAGKKISFVFDTRLNPNIVKAVKDADLFFSECTFLDEEVLAKERYHMTVDQVTKSAKKAKVGKLILMHISQKHEMHNKEFLKEAKKNFKSVVIAEDLMKFEV